MNRRALLCSVLSVMGPIASAESSTPAAERERIERLCDAVGASKGMYFIRNGREHSADDAAKFLREKYKAMGDEVKTAEDFIDKIGTKSSMSGKPYLVRFPDGREMSSAEFLRTELARTQKK
jgi:hypothetical protein